MAEAEPVLRELLPRDASLHGIEVIGAGLEEAFLALTQDGNGIPNAVSERRIKWQPLQLHFNTLAALCSASLATCAAFTPKKRNMNFSTAFAFAGFLVFDHRLPGDVLRVVRLVLNGQEAAGNGTHYATYLIATFGTFGVMGASLFGTAAGLASERGLGWLQVKRASPMPPFAYFAGQGGR